MTPQCFTHIHTNTIILQKVKAEHVDAHPECYVYAKKIMEGLQNVQMVRGLRCLKTEKTVTTVCVCAGLFVLV